MPMPASLLKHLQLHEILERFEVHLGNCEEEVVKDEWKCGELFDKDKNLAIYRVITGVRRLDNKRNNLRNYSLKNKKVKSQIYHINCCQVSIKLRHVF